MELKQISVSLCKAWVECPTKAYYSQILRRVQKDKPLALGIGTLWHRAMEAKGNRKDPIEVTDLLPDIPPDTRAEWDNTLRNVVPFVAFMDGESTFKTEVEMKLDNFFWSYTLADLVGRLDAISLWNGKLWHRQYKTLASSVPPAVFSEVQRTDWHECVYQKMLEEQYGNIDIGGTILYIVRKLSPKAIALNPEQALVPPMVVTRDYHIVDDALKDVEEVGEDILTALHTGHIRKHPQACGGKFGNSLCPYRDVCFGNKSIDDDSLFTTEEPRYKEEANG